jgi:hypothetical protein
MKSNWSISDGKHKLVHNELFDLESDPGEQHNIAAAHPKIAAKLHAEFVRWLEEVSKGQKFQPAPIQVGRADENPVEIQASWALIDGTESSVTHPYSKPTHPPTAEPTTVKGATINYTFAAYDWDTIDGWKKPDETASWSIDVVAGGDYEVTLVYGCDPRDAGGRFRIEAGEAKLDGEVAATVQREIFETRKIGMLRLKKGPAMLRVRVVSVPGRELMALNRLYLRRLESK